MTGTEGATVVSAVDGSTAANVHSAELAANAATNANTASTIIERDASGNFSAGTITASLSGNATTATTATNFSGSLVGDVTGTQGATVVSAIGGSTAANVHSAELAANAATNANIASTIVKRDASGNFSAGTITASLSGNATNVTGTVAAGNGGTGVSSYTAGDLLYASGSSAFSKLSVGANPNGYVLTLSSGLPAWEAASGGGGSGWGLSGNSLAGTEVLGSTNAEPLVIETNGAERMRILSGGNVGIGTINPGQSLEIKNGALLLSNGGTAQQLQLQGTGSGTSTFQSGAQSSTTINYTLPTAQPAANQVLAATAVSGSGPYAVTLGWASVPIFVKKTANQDFTSTTPAGDNQLSVALVANATYTFDAFLSCIDSNANGANGDVGLAVPTGATALYGVNSAAGLYTLQNIPSAGSAAAVIKVQLENVTSGDQNFIEMKGIVVTGSSSGNLQLKFGIDRTGTHFTMIVTQNSYLTVTRVQ